MKKRLFAIMLALAMLLVAVPALAEEGGEALETAANTICKICGKEVEGDLCATCAAKTKGGTNGDSTGSSGDNTDDNTDGNPDNNAVNTDNNGGNTGESSNPNSTDSSDSTGGDTGTNGGQKPPTSDEEGGGGEQPDNPQQQCTHNNVKYVQYDTATEDRYSNHKKVCMDCRIELVEPHQWDENTKKPKTEGPNIPTCTNGGDWTVQCRLCGHVTVLDGLART